MKRLRKKKSHHDPIVRHCRSTYDARESKKEVE